MTTATAQAETLEFQAETRYLLELMINSLYTTKEIFLRELISNASDALDRLRFEALTRPELIQDHSRLEITLEADPVARTLIIRDNGIGMSRDEVIANIGTIAKSGTRELREQLRQGASNEALLQLIGQFGVGFYSSFMVADKVSLLTRRAGETTSTRWESTGDGQYTIAEAAKESSGTEITLTLKAVDVDAGLEDFTDQWILKRLVKKYSDFVAYPIVLKTRRDTSAEADAEDQILNSMKPIWTRSPNEVSEDEYAEFYKGLTHDFEPSLMTIQAKAEGKLEYQALLFIPSKAPYDLFYHASEPSLRLYAKGVLIMDRCPDLLPHYLRFIKGVVDLEEIPLNISRQMPQQKVHLTLIRKWLTKKVLDALENTFEKDNEKYLRFWKAFGRALKESIGTDHDNKDRLVPLFLFESSNDPEKLTTLRDYVSRMKKGQKEIFYLTGETRALLENSPHVEAFKDKGYEVLYLVDPVDELVTQTLTEFEGKRLKSLRKGTVSLGDDEESEQAGEALKKIEEETSELLKLIQQSLDQHVKEVRLTNRLTTSPACLVGSEMDYSPQMERLLQMGKGSRPLQRRVLELNPAHEIFVKLQQRFHNDKDDPTLGSFAVLLLGSAFLAEGSELPDPVRFNQCLAEFMTKSL